MRSSISTWTISLLFSAAALLSFLARTFIDYGFVYQELHLTTSSLGIVTLFNLAFFAAWVWALVVASHASKRAMTALFIFDILLTFFGVATLVSLCPSPCQTAWPVGEIAIWSNLAIGIPATAIAAMSLIPKAGPKQ